MFCPQCGANNDGEQNYCRRCGQALAVVRRALSARADEAPYDLRGGERWLRGGAITISVFTLVALVVAIISVAITGPTYNISIIVNLALALAIGLPMLARAGKTLRAAGRLLEDPPAERAALTKGERAGALPPPATAGPLTAEPPAPASVTEHTTVHLDPPARARRPGKDTA
jgi:hypothetical protein